MFWCFVFFKRVNLFLSGRITTTSRRAQPLICTNKYLPNYNFHFLGARIEILYSYHLTTEFVIRNLQELRLLFLFQILVLRTWNHVYTVVGFSTSWSLVYISSKIWFSQLIDFCFLQSFPQVCYKILSNHMTYIRNT